ncbi:aliphatic sulfonate ABC transporter substrate-binding protein [Lysinimonas soli]|uniref:Aliphatic sulfonate ABC transporter substrate-binding protein n=1 Tax=Lysinimonas soli TaxID=1074233 RepID=A0ABW0NRB3_9MICO
MIATIAAAATAISGCAQSSTPSASSTAEIPTIEFGYIGDFNGSYALAVADKLGLWSKYGVKIDPKVFTNGPLQIQAMQTGDIDTGSIGPGALWMAAAGQAKVISINGLGLADRVVALPGKGISSIKDLRGKKVAVPQGTSGDMILQLALKRAHMTEADIQPVNMDPSTVVSALSAGQVDAAAIWYPLVDTIKKAQPGLIELASDKEFYPKNTFPGTIVASNHFAATNKPALVKLLKVLQAANDYWLTHKEQTIKLTAEYLKIPEATVKSNAENIMYPTTAELVTQSKDGTSAKWLSDLASIFVGMGKLGKAKDIKDWYLSELWPEAAASR